MGLSFGRLALMALRSDSYQPITLVKLVNLLFELSKKVDVIRMQQ